MNLHKTDVAIIGAGFSGLSAAYELSQKGFSVEVIEVEKEIGGLASAFVVGGQKLDRFYHHWFTNDMDVMNLIEELGLKDQVEINPTNTGIYYANNFFKLSTPWDLLNFTPLNFIDRIRLGLLALRARRVRDWKKLENKTAEEWLKELGGKNVYKIVWQPLLQGKFGSYAKDISAVWFWNKLKLRGGSRGKGGEERLAYYKGGFVSLAEAIAKEIKKKGNTITTGEEVLSCQPQGENWLIKTTQRTILAKKVISTLALPLTAELVSSWATPEYLQQLRRIQYLANTCLVLELNKSLSKTYWLNVNDPSFPFVGVIEHTNFESAKTYNGRHIVYLSKYLPPDDRLYSLNADEFLDYAFPFLKKMFPLLQRDWILAHHVWKARWAQPVVEKHYSSLIPAEESPAKGFYLCSMAQIYPEDRGTNYAIREGRKIGRQLVLTMQ